MKAGTPNRSAGSRRRPLRAPVLWGHAPGKESASEASAEKKIGRMLKLKRENGSLDSVDPDRAIDVRDADELELAAIPEDTFEK